MSAARCARKGKQKRRKKTKGGREREINNGRVTGSNKSTEALQQATVTIKVLARQVSCCTMNEMNEMNGPLANCPVACPKLRRAGIVWPS